LFKNNWLAVKKYFHLVLACSGVVYYYITKSPQHCDDRTEEPKHQETNMNTSISTKLAALGLALAVNTVIMGGMAYLFNAQLQQPTAIVSLASVAATLTSTAV
jgi:hypothetical protein